MQSAFGYQIIARTISIMEDFEYDHPRRIAFNSKKNLHHFVYNRQFLFEVVELILIGKIYAYYFFPDGIHALRYYAKIVLRHFLAML